MSAVSLVAAAPSRPGQLLPGARLVHWMAVSALVVLSAPYVAPLVAPWLRPTNDAGALFAQPLPALSIPAVNFPVLPVPKLVERRATAGPKAYGASAVGGKQALGGAVAPTAGSLAARAQVPIVSDTWRLSPGSGTRAKSTGVTAPVVTDQIGVPVQLPSATAPVTAPGVTQPDASPDPAPAATPPDVSPAPVDGASTAPAPQVSPTVDTGTPAPADGTVVASSSTDAAAAATPRPRPRPGAAPTVRRRLPTLRQGPPDRRSARPARTQRSSLPPRATAPALRAQEATPQEATPPETRRALRREAPGQVRGARRLLRTPAQRRRARRGRP